MAASVLKVLLIVLQSMMVLMPRQGNPRFVFSLFKSYPRQSLD